MVNKKEVSGGKIIVKNTIMLYIRMFFVMLVGFFATRVVLQALGEIDYGIYNVVGGIVVMFSFLSKVLASASQRFFAFELGRENYKRLNQLFNITIFLYVIITILLVLCTEGLGVWFLKYKATIPDERMFAAKIILQLSILSFTLHMFTTPYQAIIIAREKMDIYAYIGVIEAILNLLLSLALLKLGSRCDLLITYGSLIFINTIIVCGLYIWYARRHYEECKFERYWDVRTAKEILSYSGWTLFGTISGVVRSQGINMLINAFFSPVVNAARGIAYQVNTAINQFSSNFYTAVRPKITKDYSRGDNDATISLVFSSSRMAYYLLMFIAIPVICFAPPLLVIWLKDVPELSPLFVELVVIIALVDSISHPLVTLAQATGKVSLFQAVVGTLQILNLPISYVFLKMGFPPEATMYVAIVIAFIALFARVIILRHLVGFPVGRYCKEVIIKLLLITIVVASGSYGLNYLYGCNPTVLACVVLFMLAVGYSVVVIVLLGLNKSEKKLLLSFVNTFSSKIIKKTANNNDSKE